MSWFILIASMFIMLFGFVILFGAPYLPVLSRQKELALDMLALRKGETLLELGCGDGRVLRAAAARGLNAVGYELNPVLVLIAYITTWKYRRQVKVIWGNYWKKDWPEAEAVFVFLLPKYMKKLDKKVIQYKHKPVKLVSFAFEVPDKEPLVNEDGLYLYKY